MHQKELIDLADKILKKEAPEEEIRKYNSWYNSLQGHEMPIVNAEEKKAALYKRIELQLKPQRQILWAGIAAAAAILLVAGIGQFFYIHTQQIHHDKATNQSLLKSNDIMPGKNVATLTLDNGKSILLNENKTGIVINAAKLTYNDGTKLIVTAEGNAVPDNRKRLLSQHTAGKMNTVSTPNGGQYQVILLDGTKVWLNAASSLKFPSTFTALKQRKVELTGEAYFEVAKNKDQPFIVQSAGQQAEVLGTHFNINAYYNEESIKTTLLEGSLRVKSTQYAHMVLLKPDQQSVLNNNALQIQQVDPETAVAWKRGDFNFKDDDFKTSMRKIARWYDVEVIYEASAPDNFAPGGWISRSKNISAVLKIMEATGRVHFKVEGRRVTVTK